MWEISATPAAGDRPQAIINRQVVDQADILVGAFWTRLGTPAGRALSGTVEEMIAAGTVGRSRRVLGAEP
jgi:hypothetical protein